MTTKKSTKKRAAKSQIRISLPDGVHKTATEVIMFHVDDDKGLMPSYDRGSNIITIDDNEGIVPAGKVFKPMSNDKHEIFLQILCDMAETHNTVVVYEKEETADFLLSLDLETDLLNK
jgi:hypothetical protein